MSSVLSRASWRYLARHPAQLALAVLGVAVGVAVVVGIDTASASASAALRSSARALSGSATHVVRASSGGVPEEVFVELALEAGGPLAAPIVARTLPLVAPQVRTLELLGVDPFSEAPFRAYAADGSGDLLAERGAWLSAATARELGVAIGGELTFAVGSAERTLRVAGTLEPNDGAAAAALADVVLTDIATAQDFLDAAGVLTRIDLAVDERDSERQLALVASLLPPSCVVEPASARTDALEAMTRAFDLNMRAFGFLALLVGVFLVYNTMTFAVVQRRPLWGTLRAVGATRGALFRLVSTEALAIGVAGTALGLVLGWQLARVLSGLVAQTINDLYYVVQVRELALEPAVLVEAALLGVGATWLGALLPAIDAMRTEPRTTLDRAAPHSRMREQRGRLALCGLVLGGASLAVLALPQASLELGLLALFLLLFGAALATPALTSAGCAAAAPLFARFAGNLGRIAARGVSSHLARSSVAIASLSIALSAAAAIGIFVDSFRATVVDWLGRTLVSDVYVSSPSTFGNRDTAALAPELVARLLAEPGVALASKFTDLELDVADGSRMFASAVELSPRARAGYRLLEGDADEAWRAFDGGALLASEALARRRSLSVGSKVTLRTADGPRELEVAGVFRDYSSDRGWALVPRAKYVELWRDERVSALGLFVDEGRDVDATVSALRARLAPGELARIRSKDELVGASLVVFERTFAMTRVLRLLACAVAVLGVLGALLAIELEREREVGVLRALGLAPRALRGIVLGQTGLMGALAGLFALPIGVAVALVLILVVNTRAFGWSLDVHVEPRVLIETFALAVASALAAGAYPAWRMARLTPAKALRGE